MSNINFIFVGMKHFFRATATRFRQDLITFCATSNFFVLAQNYFSCNTKCLLCTSFGMLCCGDIFLLSHSNKNIITCQKIIKSHFYVTKKLLSFFVHHNFFIFSFYIAHWQYVDLLCSGPGNKETFSPSFTHLSDVSNHLLSKSCSQNA